MVMHPVRWPIVSPLFLPLPLLFAPFCILRQLVCDTNLQRSWRTEGERLRPESLKQRSGLPLSVNAKYRCW